MILNSLQVKNFRCIRDATLGCDQLTIIVGANGSGKSTFLRALQFFYDAGATYSQEDFYNRRIDNPIEISVKFSEFSAAERKLFGHYVQGDTLTVEKVMAWPVEKGSQRYFGIRLRHEDFSQIRTASNAKEQKQLYESLRAKTEYVELLPWTNKTESMSSLEAWENAHPDQCKPMRDDAQFFGFKQVGEVRLERHSRFVLVPAVEDAANQGSEGKATALTQIMDLVVRDALRKRVELTELQEDFKTRSNEIFNKAKCEELQRLQDELTSALAEFGSDAEVQLAWHSEEEMEIPLPRASVRLREDGYPAPVGATGHGLQRLFIMALLQRLAAASSAVDESTKKGLPVEEAVSSEKNVPSIVLVIEEPELYQHPNRQRSMARIFRQLSQAGIPGVASQVQIICTTHSPMFLIIEYFDQIRLARKTDKYAENPRETSVSQATLAEITREMERVWARSEGSFTVNVTREKLRNLMTSEVNEGFLAEVAVLVEGLMDRAILCGYADAKNVSVEKLGISVIPCSGKSNLSRPAAIFRKLGIPTYVIWDNDEHRKDEKGKNHPEENRRLLRLHRTAEEDFPVVVEKDFAALQEDMDLTVQRELGREAYGAILKSLSTTFDSTDPEILKTNPFFMEQVFKQAVKGGKECPTLANILSNIQNLKR